MVLKLPSDVYQLSQTGISCHAWNKDRSLLALCPNTKQVIIYKVSGTAPNRTFEKAYELDEHDQLVSAMDWAPETNRLVTCSHDRNAYVWTLHDNVWKPTLVLLRINRAAIRCKWSPKENKFAVTSGAKCVSVCYFEEENDWWVSKMIKKHKSTVTDVDWHPNNVVISTASTDFRARVFSAFVKDVDDKASSPVTKCGELLAEYPSKGWVHSARFSPSGDSLLFVSHDSTFSVADVAPVASGSASGDQAPAAVTVRHSGLPFTAFAWVSDAAAVAVGHDINPTLLANAGSGWAVAGAMDKGDSGETKAKTGVSAAFAKFQAQASTGENAKSEGLKTRHQMLISGIEQLDDGTLSTCGLDGRFAFWGLDKYLNPAKNALK